MTEYLERGFYHMKKLSYSLSQLDISTLLCTLDILQDIDDFVKSATQKVLNDDCCKSAMKKLIFHRTDFDNNDIRVMAASLSIAQMILSGQVQTTDENKKRLAEYADNIDYLQPIYNSVF
jgi:hypothetical protein